MILFVAIALGAEVSCREEARTALYEAELARWHAERDRLVAAAAAQWKLVRAEVDQCLAATAMAERAACAGPVEVWVRDADELRVRLPRETRQVGTACGPRVVHLRAESERVDAHWIEDRREAGWVLDWMRNPTEVALTTEIARREQADRLESIQNLRGLLESSCGSEQKAEMLFALARLYFYEGRYRGDSPEGTDYVNRSIKIYRMLLTSYPAYGKNDAVLLFLGRALLTAGQPDEAAEQLSSLARRFPESPCLPDAYVLLGDYWRAKGDVMRARTAYQRASEGARARGDTEVAETAEAALAGLPE